MIKSMILAGCGGFVGTCGRYLVGKIASSLYLGVFPLGTFMANIVGCFIIGVLFGLLERGNVLSANANMLLITGFCGGFTTFSTFANDAWNLGSKGSFAVSIAYVVASVILGILMVWLGRWLLK